MTAKAAGTRRPRVRCPRNLKKCLECPGPSFENYVPACMFESAHEAP